MMDYSLPKHEVIDAYLSNYEITSNSIFISEIDIIPFFICVCKNSIDLSTIKLWLESNLLPVYKVNNCNCYLKTDLISIVKSVCLSNKIDNSTKTRTSLFDFDEHNAINIGTNTVVDFPYDALQKDPVFFSALRNLSSVATVSYDSRICTTINIPYFSGARITTSSSEIEEFTKKQLELNQRVDMSTVSQFARSAHYMGSKRSLCGFIVEGISSVLPDDGVVVDLMCGSGVLSGAFSRVWETYSSDAQDFCKVLSCVHSGGIDRSVGQEILSKLSNKIKQNFDCLSIKISDWMTAEEDYFCNDIDESLLLEYQTFIESFPTLPNGKHIDLWNPQEEVNIRRSNLYKLPYCLFTTYFANVYFGLRQCVEIDSIRYAIDQLEDTKEKTWALGALISTLSALGSTYGGHFAQPGVDFNKMTLSKLSSVITTRSFSISHEFSVRLLNLSEQSALSSRSITPVAGPWPDALTTLGGVLEGRNVLVYVDPPYKREEYSRYYHVLETLVTYQYPSCTGKGLTPQPGDRFRSEFITRTESTINTTLISLIINVLQRGWMCGWSYSDSGVANISQVISEVNKQASCLVKSYAVPFQHKSQGGASPKNVTEYFIIFSPK